MKSQFEPDLLIGVAIVILVGLGGILAINSYMKSVNMKAIFSAQDREVGATCFFILSSYVGDYYIHKGAVFSETDGEYYKLQNYYGGYDINREWVEKSIGGLYLNGKYVGVAIRIGSYMSVPGGKIYCTYPSVYSPSGSGGVAYLYQTS